MSHFVKEEKKVEYLELIYDLIFVYIVGRNNSLLHNVEKGFVEWSTFLAYILCSLAIIQIWNFSIFYINMHGRNGLKDHIFLFINMYLLYYIGEGTRVHWQSYQTQYSVAWALILLNIGVQYLIEYRNHRGEIQTQSTIKKMVVVLFGEVAIVLLSIPVFNLTGKVLAPVAILFGIIVTTFYASRNREGSIDFAHLSERAMLYVVFTFGEIIIILATYFEGHITFNTIYFATMSFLIVVGLFLCYGVLYDCIIDREMKITGMNYMLIHIFLIFGLNMITTSLEFMRDAEVDLLPKMLMLIGSFLLYFICLFALQGYAKSQMKLCRRFITLILSMTITFIILMIVFREKMYINIVVSVLFVFGVFIMIYIFSKQQPFLNSNCKRTDKFETFN